jgi:hypothetical protein
MKRVFLAAILFVAGCVPVPDMIDLQFPYGGLVRATGYQYQKPYTTLDCVNVRPRDASTGRMRGGSRPMLVKAYQTELAGGEAIRLLASVSLTGSSRSLVEGFDGSELSSAWNHISGPNWVMSGSSVGVESPSATTSSPPAAYYRRAVPANLDTGEDQSYEWDIRLINRESCKWALYCHEDGTATGIKVEIWQDGTYLADGGMAWYLYVNGVLQDSDVAYVDPAINSNGTVRVEYTVTGSVVKVYWRGVEILSSSGTAPGASNDDFGLAMLCGYRGTSGYGPLAYVSPGVDEIRVYYEAIAGGETASSRMVAIAGPGAAAGDGDMYMETADGAMAAVTVTGGAEPDSSALLQAATHLGKLYIVNSTKALVFDAGTETLDVWTDLVGVLDLDGMKIICEWNGRIVVSDGTSVYYMSRQGVPTDFDFGAVESDTGRAVAGTSSDTDQLGQPITAFAPMSRDYLAMGCASSLWMMAGDPAAGGSFVNLSRSVGIIGPSAWCVTPEGILVFLSSLGVYVASPGSTPMAISKAPLPRELFNVNPADCVVQMAYDAYDEGVYIFLTPVDGGTITSWFIDWESRSFWPSTYYEAHQPTAIFSHDKFVGSGSRVMMGGSDGYIRRHSSSAGNDDGETVNSYVYYGPIRLGGLMNEGTIDILQAVLGESSNPVGWQIRVGDTGETSLDREVFASGEWGAGRNPPDRPRVRGASCNIKLFSSKYWTIEEMVMVRSTRGLIRQ